MKRLQLFEFEDFHWLPSFIRTSITNLIIVFHRMMGTSEVLIDLILKSREKVNFNQIVDMGSGSGGPMPDVVEKLNQNSAISSPISLVLTDKFPSATSVQKINAANITNIHYQPESLDAVELENAPKGLKTMIASFHHMPPTVAKKILQAAEKNKTPFLIYEVAENNIPVVVWWVLLPLSLIILIIMSLIMTPFTRSVSIPQIIFTYFIPIIPLVYAWDGQASLMRTYTFEDIEGLIGEQDNDNYRWEISQAKKSDGKTAGYYVLGYPTT